MTSLRGSIHARPNGTYTAVTEPMPHGAGGSRRRVSLGTYPTREAAHRRLAEYNLEPSGARRAGRSSTSELTVLAEWLRSWAELLETRQQAGILARSTASDYRRSVRIHIEPRLGRYRIGDLEPDVLERFQLDLKGSGLADQTVLKVWRTLHKCLADAHLRHNPCSAVTSPRVRIRRTIVRPTVDEVLAFNAHAAQCNRDAGKGLAVLWRLLATTGLRRGEVCALAWEDVDLDAGLLTVSRAMGHVDRQLFLKQPKSQAGFRTIGLDTRTIDMLRQHWTTRGEEVEGHQELPFGIDLVFRWRHTGSPVHPDNLSVTFRQEWRHAGLREGVTLHGLRHAHGSALLLAGLPPVQVAAHLGHAPHVLLSIYAGELDSAARQSTMAKAATHIYG